MKNNKGFAPILIVLIIVGVLALGGGTYYFLTKKEPKPVACTQEAKICPDGSTVGRTGLNCEFAACPTIKADETADWKTFKSTEYDYEVKYPADWINYGELWGGFNITSPIIDGHADNRIIVMADQTLRSGTETNQEYIDNMVKENIIPGINEINTKEEVTVNGIKGYKIIWNLIDFSTKKFDEGPLYIWLETPTTNKTRFIILQLDGKGSQYQTNLETFNLMLSTFKFSK